MIKEAFSVGCHAIAFHNGVVVLDLNGLSLTEKDEQGRPLKEMNQRVIMTAEGAVETFDALKGLLDRLVEVGILTRKEPGESGGGGIAAKGQPKSPNFQA